MTVNASYNALVIDDEPSVRGFVTEVLLSDGWHASEAESAAKAFEILEKQKFDLIFCDVLLGDADGYEVLKRFASSFNDDDTKFVLMTGHASAAGALDATAIGAFDYLVKPFSVADVLRVAAQVREQLLRKNTGAEVTVAEKDQDKGYTSDIPLIGNSPLFVECLKMVGRVAPTNLPVLITGESGTGKELVAAAIHKRSRRADGPFITVNCGAIPTELIESELFGHAKGSFTGAGRERVGLWEEASGGTLFLDEITETTPQFQVKLLRALQESEIRRVGSNQTIKVDARIICATNRSIESEVESGRFRQDLMYRLNAITISLPPLRQRVDDIPTLIDFFSERFAGRKVAFSPEALELMKSYQWPGNVRELENAVLHAVSMTDSVIYPEHLPERIRRFTSKGSALENRPFPSPSVVNSASGQASTVASATPKASSNLLPENELTSNKLPTLDEIAARYVSLVLEKTEGNKQAAARILGIDRKTLSRILARGQSESAGLPEAAANNSDNSET
jgi:DNA-binding NtrC family response regulator